MKKMYATLCYLIIAVSGFAQVIGDYRSNGNVDFTTPTRWQVLTALPSTWTAATIAPVAANLQSANKVTILPNDQLNFSTNVNFISNNDFTILIQGDIGTGSVTASYGNGLSTVRIERSGNFNDNNVFRFHTFRKLELVGIGGTRNFTIRNPLIVTNTLNITNANLSVPSLTLSGNTVTVNAGGNLSITGPQSINNSDLTINLSGNNRTLNFQNNLTISGSTGSTVGVNFSGTGGNIFATRGFTMTNSQLNVGGSGTQLTITETTPTLVASSISMQGSNQQISFPNAAVSLTGNSLIKLLSANGNLSLGNNATFPGANASNYIQLGSTSTVTRQISNGNSNSFTFPIGTSAYFLPLGVTANGPGANNTIFTAGVFTGATLDGTPGGTALNKSTIVDAVWTLSQDANQGKSVNLNASWQAALEGNTFAGFTNLNQIGMSLGTQGSSSWAPAVSGSGGNLGNRNFSINSLTIPQTTTSSLVIGQVNQTLPILIKNFTATVINRKIKLQWLALATSMDGHFEVERSASQDGKFELVGKVPVHRVGDAIYTYTDEQALATDSYYRIRSVDENGHETLSKTIRVNVNETPFMLNQVYPTICRQNLNLSVNSSKSDKLTIKIIDISGRIALAKDLQAGAGTNSYSLDLGRLATGQYVVIINNGEKVYSSRFIKQ